MAGFGTAITALIGADVGPLQASGPQVERAVGGIAGKMEKRLAGTQNVASTLATALGLNLQNMAEGVARFITGVSKEAEEAWKELAELSGRVADRTIAANRAKLDLQQQYTLSLQDEERLQKRIAENVYSDPVKQAERERDKLALLDKQAASAALLAKINEAAAAKNDAALKNERALAADIARIKEEAAKKAMSEDERALAIEQEIHDAEQARLATAVALKAQKLADIEEVKRAEIAAFNEAAAIEKARVAEMFKSFIDQWTGFSGLINSVGRGDRDLSERELARKIGNLQSDVFSRESNQFQRGGYDFFLDPKRSNLSGALAEQRLRGEARQARDTFGDERAFGMFNFTEQRWAEIMRTATAGDTIVSELKELNGNLTSGRVRVGTIAVDEPRRR